MCYLNDYVDNLFIICLFRTSCVLVFCQIIINENFLEKNEILSYTNVLMSQTYNPKKRKRKRAHGFLGRSSTPGGRNVLKKRRQKGRAKLSV